jgi:hypothetical protein
MDNLELYNKLRTPPKDALRAITAGRLKGKTDINPMWRIKALTETFGPCGIGWKYVIKDKRLETTEVGETAAFVDIDLFYKWEGEWSDAIPGTGGNMFVANEKNGSYVDDECYKKALTDAISVAAKALGVGGDVYWQKDPTKYTASPDQAAPRQQASQKPESSTNSVKHFCAYCGNEILPAKKKDGTVMTADDIATMSLANFGAKLCSKCIADPKAIEAAR